MAKALKNESDITIGDYWGIQNIDSKFDDDKGCSAVLINTNKGSKIFEEIKNKVVIKKSRIDEVLEGNKLLIKSVEKKGVLLYNKNRVLCNLAFPFWRSYERY
jgi:coenzyme F420-reducing hydrogenase beta subunit